MFNLLTLVYMHAVKSKVPLFIFCAYKYNVCQSIDTM